MLSQPPPLELWAGVECTVNRVGDEYFDQLERNGHAHRLDDLDLFADLACALCVTPCCGSAPHLTD